jgi:hypothetical protein
MNPNVSALEAALILIGETEDSIERGLLKFEPKEQKRCASFEGYGSKLYYHPKPELTPKERLSLLYQFAWERIWAETQKAVNLEAKHPDLLNNPEFVAYKQAVQHASDIAWGCPMFVAGKGCVKTYAEPDLKGHRIGSWDEVSEGM